MLSHKSGSNAGSHASHNTLTSIYDMPYSSVCKGGLIGINVNNGLCRVAMELLFTLPIACDILLLFWWKDGCQICSAAPGLLTFFILSILQSSYPHSQHPFVFVQGVYAFFILEIKRKERIHNLHTPLLVRSLVCITIPMYTYSLIKGR